MAQKLLRLRGSKPQNVAAIAAGIRPPTLCRLERGQRGAAPRSESVLQRAETLRRLAVYYEVLPEYLTADLCTYLLAWAATTLTDTNLRTPGARLQRLANELGLRYDVQPADLARELLLSDQDLEDYLVDRLAVHGAVLERLREVTGIPPAWITAPQLGPAIDPSAYERSTSLAAASGLPPSVLEEFVRTWLKNHTQK